ncbi:MAG: signal peptide peptidase SppA, partial [Candidatus Dormibacteraeota bacterium]|nr:signal peptide peptidase SppA [Candidatus Dormibacteraeota bacterium]
MFSDDDFSERLSRFTDRRRIALIQVRGVIDGVVRTEALARTLGAARRNRRIRAAVLDIDSPGGGAVGSEVLHVAVKRLAAEKPVVAWIRSTGASGAYFLACGATRIVAFPSAIVGSIGVISVRPIAVEALRRLGTRIDVTKTGPLKDMGAPWRDPTDEDAAKERELVDAIFRRFTGAVRAARGFDDVALARVTTGEVWLAAQALELGLVDALVDDEDSAIEVARDLAGLPHRHTQRLGRRRTVMQLLGVPGAGIGPPSVRWINEMEGWLTAPR